MSEAARRFTSIGRPVDRRYPTNRAIASLSLGVAVLGFTLRRLTGTPSLESFLAGIFLALGFFLAWAIARELDPDHDQSAFVAAVLGLLPGFVLGRPDIAAVLLVLLMLRIVNRTVGPEARPVDTLGILFLVGVAVWRGHLALAGAAALAFTLDAILNPPYRVHLAAAGAAIGLLAFGVSRLPPAQGYPPTAPKWLWLALAMTLPFLVLIRATGKPRTVSDAGGQALSGSRVRAAQWLGLTALLASVLVEGRAGLAALSPLWAALVGTGVYFSIGAPTRFPHSVHDPS